MSPPGTEKVRQAQGCKHLHVVNPDWLWACLERWERVEERLFPLKEDYNKSHRYLSLTISFSSPLSACLALCLLCLHVQHSVLSVFSVATAKRFIGLNCTH